jgi:CO/xanthine dehydrogenase Mo-binding subunit
MNLSLAEYHAPVNADVPRIGIAGAAAALANAIFHATGKRGTETFFS